MNVLCVLYLGRVISLYFFHEDLIISSSFLQTWETYSLLQLNSNNSEHDDIHTMLQLHETYFSFCFMIV